MYCICQKYQDSRMNKRDFVRDINWTDKIHQEERQGFSNREIKKGLCRQQQDLSDVGKRQDLPVIRVKVR